MYLTTPLQPVLPASHTVSFVNVGVLSVVPHSSSTVGSVGAVAVADRHVTVLLAATGPPTSAGGVTCIKFIVCVIGVPLPHASFTVYVLAKALLQSPVTSPSEYSSDIPATFGVQSSTMPAPEPCRSATNAATVAYAAGLSPQLSWSIVRNVPVIVGPSLSSTATVTLSHITLQP